MDLRNLDLQGSPQTAEITIADYHRRPATHTQSTDELLPPETHLESDEVSVISYDSATPENLPTSFNRETPEAIESVPSIQLRIAITEFEGDKTENQCTPPESSAKNSEQNVSKTQDNYECHENPNHDPSRGEVAPSSPPRLRIGVSEDDIELEHFALPVAGTRSVDRLVPLPNVEPEPETPITKENNHGHCSASGLHQITTPGPNYKPLPLRWPFQVFLVALIAGMCAFLEYQIHNLPPIHYQALQIGPPNQNLLLPIKTAVTPTHTPAWLDETTHIIKASPLPKGVLVAPTTTRMQVETPVDNRRRYGRAPTPAPKIFAPAPDPRLRESDYPHPGRRVTAFCGWGRPRWLLNEEHGDSPNFNSYLIIERMFGFITNDPSWCPCTVNDPLDTGAWTAMSWETNDRGCRSAMKAVDAFDAKKRHITPWYHVDKSGWTNSSAFGWRWAFTTPPSDLRPWWGYPSTNLDGDVLFPVEIRTPRLEMVDIFGNRAERSKTATFLSHVGQWGWENLSAHDMETSEITPCSTDYNGPDEADNWTWMVPRLPNCTHESGSFSTGWFTLPFGRPTTTHDITKIGSLTTTSDYIHSTESSKSREDTGSEEVQLSSMLRVVSTLSTLPMVPDDTSTSPTTGGDQDAHIWTSSAQTTMSISGNPAKHEASTGTGIQEAVPVSRISDENAMDLREVSFEVSKLTTANMDRQPAAIHVLSNQVWETLQVCFDPVTTLHNRAHPAAKTCLIPALCPSLLLQLSSAT